MLIILCADTTNGIYKINPEEITYSMEFYNVNDFIRGLNNCSDDEIIYSILDTESEVYKKILNDFGIDLR